MHDARVFVTSGIEEILETLPDDMHVLGDSAYPLKRYLMCPFRDNGHLSAVQLKYNKRHSQGRAVIERAFGRLKLKFRRLMYLDMSRMDLIPKFIGTACFLHNFIILNTAEGDSDEELEQVTQDDDVGAQEEGLQSDTAANVKRMEIADSL